MSKFMNRPPPVMTTAPTSSTFVEKIMVGLDHAPAAFDLRGQLIGAGGANLHYIRNETGAIATLRGRGSLFIDPALGTESPEPMHLYIEHARYEGLQSAKQLAKNLIETLQQELVHFQQVNPPVQFTNQQGQMQNSQVITGQQPMSQMSVPPPMLAVPPPPVQSNIIDQMNSTQPSMMQQPNYMQQNPPTLVSTQQQPAILQQQTLIPQTVPIHLQTNVGNMVIQQQVQPGNVSNVSIPPPGLHIPVKQGQQLVHLQAPPPTPVHLSQPPPNIQLQQQPQIVLNQTQPNYQYQYIQQTPIQTTDGQQNQVTIQHIYQPQGIVQQSQQQAAQFNQFAAQQTIRSQQIPQTQQYIVQGNTAYMVPPPNMIQQQQQGQPGQPQNIIFQTTGQNQTSQIQLHQMQMTQPHPQPPAEPVNPAVNVQNTSASSSTGDEAGPTVKEEKSSPDCNESPVKGEDKSDSESGKDDASSQPQNHPQMPPQLQNLQHQQLRSSQYPPTSTINTITQVPPPLMAVPPPISCVQHIVGNTLITTSQPTQPQTHQIYNQIPVSIQQIQAPQQQIHVSTQNGQHFLVNAQQWQPQQQFQQVSQNGNIQSFQLTAAQPMRNPNEIVVSNQAIIGSTNQATEYRGNLQQQQHILATTFNPHIPAPGMQVQFQPIASLGTQQIMHTMSDGQHQIIEQSTQGQHLHQHQVPHMHNSSMQPPMGGTYGSMQQPPPSQTGQLHETLPKGNGPIYPIGGSPQPVPPPAGIQMQDPHPQSRIGQKRKRDLEDEQGPPMPPRMGMGSNIGGQYLNNQRDMQQSANNNGMTIATSSGSVPTSSSQDEQQPGSNNDSSTNNGAANHNSNGRLMESHQQQQGSASFAPDNRQQFYRMPFDGPPQQGPRGPGPRFHPNNNRNEFAYPPMRPPHMMPDGNFPMHRMNFGPPPPPPPPQQMYPRIPQSHARYRGGQW